MNNTSVESYLAEGCGRCDLFQTPQCKVLRWPGELLALRALLRDSGLQEAMKWGAPCYMWEGGNVLMLSALKDGVAVGFFKGSLLSDPEGRLQAPGPNSQAARQLRFTSTAQVQEAAPFLRQLIAQAIELEKVGARVTFNRAAEPIPEELQARLDSDPILAEAWQALTPGRRRSYVLHIAGAKQASTRETRVERCAPMIMEGRGFNERPAR